MNIERLKQLIILERKLDPLNEVEWQQIFEEKTKILCENLQETIQFINSSTQEEFYWISNAFENISEKYKSQEFIDCLRCNQKRFPEIYEHIEMEIEFAIIAMND